jgi:oligopeptide transport system ATP-binding protein
MENANKTPLLSVKDLRIHFSTDHGYVQAVRGVSFDLYKGETLCIVGESGSGKSVTNKAIMGILSSNGRIVEGSIMYEGEDLTKVSEDEFHRIRGHKIGMIFQDPLSSLNPIMRIGQQITEAMLINGSRTKKMYNDLVSDELVAYKNSQTELRTGVAKYSENIKFLKSEKKKQIAQAKNHVSNEIEGRKYSLKREFGSIKFAIDDEFNSKKLEAQKLDADKKTELLASANEVKNEKLAKAKEDYTSKAQQIKEDKPHIVEESKQQIAEITEKFDKQIAELKEVAKQEIAELKAKYKPIIAENKAAFKAKSKEAKAKVREFKKEKRAKYHEKRKEVIKKNFSKETKFSLSRFIREYKKCREHYVESIRITKAEAKARALKIMAEVGIKDPEKRYRQYPFEFSGGMRQRIVIAIALTADPDILICDEPTTALDVTIQAQILELINNLKKERQLSCIFITHDLGVVANMADRVAVMYAGKIVEYGTEEEIFYDPKHPYTWALLSSIPDVDSNEKLEAIPGTPPNMIYPPKGDAFALRSKYAMEIDFKKEPPFFKVSDTHYAATWLLDPRAPKVEMPAIVKTRIANSLKAKKGGSKNA